MKICHEIFPEHLTGMGGGDLPFGGVGYRHCSSSMIVGYFDIEGIAVDESEAYPPLAVDRYGVLPLAGPFQGVQPVAGGHAQII
jgi:hypothetical protein